MSSRTVRLDSETEAALAELRKLTGLSVSEVLKRGINSYRLAARSEAVRKPYDVYSQLDLGEGGYAIAPASAAKSRVAQAIRRKHKR